MLLGHLILTMIQGFRATASTPSNSTQDAFGAFLASNGPNFQNLSIPSDHAGFQPPHLSSDQHHRRLLPPSFHSAVQLSPPVSSGNASAPLYQHQSSNASLRGASNWAQDFARFSQDVSSAGGPTFMTPNSQHYHHWHAGFPHNMMSFPSSSLLGGTGVPATAARHGTTVNTAVVTETDFDLEMDQWMAAHGDKRIEDVDAIMEELARQMEQDIDAPCTSQQAQNLGTSHIMASDTTLAEQQGEQAKPASVAVGRGAYVGAKATSSSIEDRVMLTDTTRSARFDDTSRPSLDEQIKAAPIESSTQEQSEISEAARQILESVQHEQGDKWKNSRFLLLMKDFRDGNKDIVDNEILETHAGGGHAGQQTTAAEY